MKQRTAAKPGGQGRRRRRDTDIGIHIYVALCVCVSHLIGTACDGADEGTETGNSTSALVELLCPSVCVGRLVVRCRCLYVAALLF